MALKKNVAGQKVAVYAFDSTNLTAKTGDAANITAQISLDGAATAATNDVNPTELDAADAPGVYIFDLTQAETNADLAILAAVSSTANIELTPLLIYTDTPDAALVDLVWDEVLTGATHNVASSSGRRLRALQDFGLYENGAVWIDTVNGTAGTTDFENGTVTNPVDSLADARTIADSIGLSAFHIHGGSAITLAANYDGFEFGGGQYSLALGGQSIEGAIFRGADVRVTGIGTATVTRPLFDHCTFAAVTVPPSLFEHCGIGESAGTFAGGSAGEYVFNDCYSVVAGMSTPVFDFAGLGATTGINNRGWAGGADYTLDSDCALSHEVLAGGKTEITTGGGDAEIRGICREVELVLSGAGIVQFAGLTGPITISGTATTTVNLYGVSTSVTDSSSGTTVTDGTTGGGVQLAADQIETWASALEATASTIKEGTAKAGTLTTTQMSTTLSEVDDVFNGRTLIFKADTTTAALRLQATTISDYSNTNGVLTFAAVTTAPAATETWVII